VEQLTFDKIVVGGSLTALLYAYKHNLPIIIDQAHMPFQLDDCPKHWNFSFIGFSSKLTHKKSQVWDRLVFLLSMAGMVIFPNNMQSFRQEEGVLSIIMNNNKRFQISYNDIVEFDRDRDETMIVYDWFAVRSGTRHDHEMIKIPDTDFVHTLLFHPSTRLKTRNDVKDVCAVSEIPESEINDLDWSEAYVRMRVLQIMKEQGIRGQANGYNKRGLQLHYAIKIEHMYRETRYKYDNKDQVEDLLKIKLDQNSDLWKLTTNLLRGMASTLLE
tara:strand:+ start:3003 stop:3818 length:816 start_codon:yes stop_codon:yes gene_type:complete